MLTHFGGSETPSHLISSALIALLEHPAALAALRADNSLADAVIEETLRYWSPVNLVFQTAARDINLHGVDILTAPTCCPILPRRIATSVASNAPMSSTSTAMPMDTCHSHMARTIVRGPRSANVLGAIALQAALERMPALRRWTRSPIGCRRCGYAARVRCRLRIERGRPPTRLPSMTIRNSTP